MGFGFIIFLFFKIGIFFGKYNDVIDGKLLLGFCYEISKDNFVDFMCGKIGNENWQKEIEMVRKLKSVVDKLGVSQSQLVVVWCLKNENVSMVIMGVSKFEQVEDMIGVLKIVDKLILEIMVEIDEIMGNKVIFDLVR